MTNLSALETHKQSFVHLHLHTQYSLLDGAIRIPELMKKATEYEMPAVAQTDHGNMFGAIDFYNAAKKAKIKPILGSEIYVISGSRFDQHERKELSGITTQDPEEDKSKIHHLILLAKNATGYRNLCEIISHAYMEGFSYRPRADYELLAKYSEGLICTSACLKGEAAYYLYRGQDEKAHQAILKYREIFKDDFYLEMQENGLTEQAMANRKILSFAQEKGIPVVATNDCHYIHREYATAHEVLVCIQMGLTFTDAARKKMTSTEFYFKTAEEMRRAFHYYPEACDNTLRIADKCNLDFKWTDDKGRQIYHLPDFKIETEEKLEDFFRRAGHEGLQERFNGPHFKEIVEAPDWEASEKKKYIDRLNHELDMIIQMGFPGYFLIVSDFIRWAKKQGIPVGPGRGSGAGSLVAYALQITNINPLPYHLLFERFINPERISMPDFDVDFCQERRDEVIRYVTQRYGTERVGQIITFGKLQAKAVIRDVARVYNLPYSEADMLAKLVPEDLGITLDKAIEKEPKLQELEEKDPQIRQILKIAKQLEGLFRHASIHAAGVVITNHPLTHYCPLFRGKEGERVIQFDKDFGEKIGLVKFDFLGLKTLTVIDNASKSIKKLHDPNFDIEAISLSDTNIYELVSSGKTTGVFQLESAGMRELCKRLKPDNLEDITAINALYRPGPLGSGMVDEFVEIKHGRKKSHYLFPELEPILKDTYGIIVYQEQVQHIARAIAGYSLGQADILRKAMGKKQMDVMQQHRQIFEKGAHERGFDTKLALELYDQMASFAEYGFNKSHAVAYALIAYQTAFIKNYYPACFYAALLSSELDDSDKITLYISDAKQFGIETLPPDINESLWQFTVVGERIRFGLGAIKNVGMAAVNAIIEERNQHGPFLSFIDFCERVPLRLINKRVLESLIKVGAVDLCEKMNRKTILTNLPTIMEYVSRYQDEKSLGQKNLFSIIDDSLMSKRSFLDLKTVEDFDHKEKLEYEKELIGVYVSGHPLEYYQEMIYKFSSLSIAEALRMEAPKASEEKPKDPKDWRKAREKPTITLAGIFSTSRIIVTKKGEKMAFANFEDMTGGIECVIFPRAFKDAEVLLTFDGPVLIEGEISTDEDPKKFFPQKLMKLQDKVAEEISEVQILISLEVQENGPEKLSLLKDIIVQHKGTVPVQLVFQNENGHALMPLGPNFLVMPTPRLMAKIEEILQKHSIKLLKNGRI